MMRVYITGTVQRERGSKIKGATERHEIPWKSKKVKIINNSNKKRSFGFSFGEKPKDLDA